MKTVATNETTQKPRGKDVVKKSPVRAGRGRRPRTGAVSTVADEVLDAVRAPETTEIEVEAEPIEAGNEAGENEAGNEAGENEAGENEAEAAADGAVGEKGSSTRSRRVVRAGRLSGLWRPRRVVAALAILALCAGGGYAGWKLYENRVVDQAEQQAVATAKDYAVTLTSIDSGTSTRTSPRCSPAPRASSRPCTRGRAANSSRCSSTTRPPARVSSSTRG